VYQGAGGSKRRYANIGDVIRVSVKDAAPRAASRRARSITPWWCARPFGVRRADGSRIRFDSKRGGAPYAKLEPIGTRISARYRELRSERFMKIVSLAPEVL